MGWSAASNKHQPKSKKLRYAVEKIGHTPGNSKSTAAGNRMKKPAAKTNLRNLSKVCSLFCEKGDNRLNDILPTTNTADTAAPPDGLRRQFTPPLPPFPPTPMKTMTLRRKNPK
jgi:hypothetical protein